MEMQDEYLCPSSLKASAHFPLHVPTRTRVCLGLRAYGLGKGHSDIRRAGKSMAAFRAIRLESRGW